MNVESTDPFLYHHHRPSVDSPRELSATITDHNVNGGARTVGGNLGGQPDARISNFMMLLALGGSMSEQCRETG